jgi:hypothetical protein
MAIAASLALSIGSLIWLVGFVWSVVLAKQKSILWLSGMVALWVVFYPIFVSMNWAASRRNLAVVLLGIVLVGLGYYLAPASTPPI